MSSPEHIVGGFLLEQRELQRDNKEGILLSASTKASELEKNIFRQDLLLHIRFLVLASAWGKTSFIDNVTEEFKAGKKTDGSELATEEDFALVAARQVTALFKALHKEVSDGDKKRIFEQAVYLAKYWELSVAIRDMNVEALNPLGRSSEELRKAIRIFKRKPELFRKELEGTTNVHNSCLLELLKLTNLPQSLVDAKPIKYLKRNLAMNIIHNLSVSADVEFLEELWEKKSVLGTV